MTQRDMGDGEGAGASTSASARDPAAGSGTGTGTRGGARDLAAEIERLGARAEIVDLGTPMPTADAAARALGVPVGAIVKSIVLRSGEKAAVAVLCGGTRLHVRAAGKVLGWKSARLAEPEFALRETGYPTGGTPPLGHPAGVPVLIDRGVLALGVAYGGGGRAELLVKIAPEELVRVTGAVVAELRAESQ